MISEDQQKWLDHLSDSARVKIIDFDPSCAEKFNKVRNQIIAHCGSGILVEHRGASSLGISGQDEIDVYIPVPANNYDDIVESLKIIFGNFRSSYPRRRTRFVTEVDGRHIDVFVINSNSKDWLDSERFHFYLLGHPTALDQYRRLKEGLDGKTIREYYTKKIEFINEVLEIVSRETI